MLKVDYLGFKLDEVYRLYQGADKNDKWEAIYINKRTLVAGSGAKPESACADAQRKIQKHVGLDKKK